MFGYKFLHIFILCGAHILVVNVLVQIFWLFGFVPIAVCCNKKPSRRGGNLVFVRAKCRTFEMFTSTAFSQCFLSKEIKTFRRENNFHSGEEVISIWISSIFLRISTSYFLLFPLLCNQRLCSQSPHQSGYSHLNLGNQKYLKMCKTEKMMLKCARLNKSC